MRQRTQNEELHAGPVTLYAQLARILRDKIYGGQWRSEDEIPTLDQLAAQYNVARVTVRQAIQMLSAEGLLSSQRGRRTTVTFQTSTSAHPLFSSVGSLDAQTGDFSIELLGAEPIEVLPARPFRQGKPLGTYMRIHKRDGGLGAPYVLSESFVLAKIFKRFPRGAERRSKIFRLVRDHAGSGIVASAFEHIRVSMPDEEEARLLEISTTLPVARVARIVLDRDDGILLFATYVYRGDRFGIERDISSVFR